MINSYSKVVSYEGRAGGRGVCLDYYRNIRER